jgi:type IV pilus assembly protein PilV
MIPLRQKGLSLIEVLIALAVFSFGLLALAALMASGLKYNTSALHRSYATNQAYDMADRMRANRLGLDSGCYDGGSDSDTDSVCFSESDTDPGCIESGCTPEQMAQYDRWQWNTDNERLLPEGAGTVRLKSSDPDIYTITIYWNDDRDSVTPDDSFPDDSFIVEFQP